MALLIGECKPSLNPLPYPLFELVTREDARLSNLVATVCTKAPLIGVGDNTESSACASVLLHQIKPTEP